MATANAQQSSADDKYCQGVSEGLTDIKAILANEKYRPTVDSTDIEILLKLSNNSNITNIELSKALGLNEITVKRRVDVLKNRDVIKGFSILLNNRMLGKNLWAHLRLRVSLEKLDEIASRMSAFEQVMILHRILNPKSFNLFAELLFSDMEEFQEFADKISKLTGIEAIEYNIATKAYRFCPYTGV